MRGKMRIMHSFAPAVALLLGPVLAPASFVDGFISPHRHFRSRQSTSFLSATPTSQVATDVDAIKAKSKLFDLLDDVPSNAPTPRGLTDAILAAVSVLERQCPTLDDDVLSELAGNWELLWTAQDKSSTESQRGVFSFINPLENQSYSNNPNRSGGRANPILPREIQDRLESVGILDPSGGGDGSDGESAPPVRSSQAIDRKKSKVRNVVSVELRRPLPVKGALIVDVAFKPNRTDKRRIDVKFDSVKLQVKNSPVDITFPLGIIGPTGWLRTGYIDDDMRITRGHKGSVFILTRTAKRKQ
eukprot:CAMPEP_0197716600 /NCGR_PEP_ID=MMETSP1434-20131217/1433_1 /TAXON_ID=265543 /ORGANISM="Minutocellus polymorphus, Strain CCMP3303" /LENGTH=300 /DNA_ID=CAMNT_0043300983 /DNA_START=87 /DNA_END=989 /DNA_ORIENTATION=+